VSSGATPDHKSFDLTKVSDLLGNQVLVICEFVDIDQPSL